MNTSMRTRLLVTALVAGVFVSVAPAAAKTITSGLPGAPGAPEAAPQNDSTAIVLRRDGSEATPFVAEAQPSGEVILPRVIPLVGDDSPKATASGDGFDWGDAAIGAGAGLLTAMLVASGAGAFRGRRRQTSTPASAVSQGI